MNIDVAREVAARIWCDQEMSNILMDVELAEEIAQLIARRLTQSSSGLAHAPADNSNGVSANR